MPNKTRDIKGVAIMATTTHLFPVLLQTYESQSSLHALTPTTLPLLHVWVEGSYQTRPSVNMKCRREPAHNHLYFLWVSHLLYNCRSWSPLRLMQISYSIPLPCLSSDCLLNSFSGTPFSPCSPHSWCFSWCYSIHDKSFTPCLLHSYF